jgi:hypothetical protein
MRTVTRLLASANADLAVIPRGGSSIDREGIRDLLCRDAPFRIEPTHFGAVAELCRCRVRFVVLGDVAARLHGAPVEVSIVEVALQEDERNRWHFQRAARSGALGCVEVRPPELYRRLRADAGPLPWLRPPTRRVLNDWRGAPTGFLPALTSLAAMANLPRSDLLAAVQQEVDVLGLGYRVNSQRVR